jgi:hypothetical protein
VTLYGLTGDSIKLILLWCVYNVIKMNSNPSICIPRIESVINKRIINSTFKNFGEVERIDIVNSGKTSRKAFVHFKSWNSQNSNFSRFLSRLNDGETVNLVYSFPWYWQCRKSNLPKPQFIS